MQLAVLFWCYKEPAICEDRLRLLRRHDPDVPIYVLFGGRPEDAPLFEERLGPLVQDVYVSRAEPPAGAERYAADFRDGATWKYVYGDVLIADWQRHRGHALSWDSVVVVQWDMLVFGRIQDVFACLSPGEVLFSGLRPLSEVETAWIWTAPDRPWQRRLYEDFLAHLREVHGYDAEPLACLAIVMAFPRTFLERFAAVERLDLGFLEYRLPMYAQAFGIPFCEKHPFRPWWGAVESFRPFSALRALPREIWIVTIVWNRMRRTGARVFHPFWGPVPHGVLGWSGALAASLPKIAWAGLRGAWQRVRRGAWRAASQGTPEQGP